MAPPFSPPASHRPASTLQGSSGTTSSPASSQVRGRGCAGGSEAGRACPSAALPTFAPSLTEVAPAPLDELRGHKALVKLRGRQERELRELRKKHQRKVVALTRRLLDSLAQVRAERGGRQRPGVL